MEILMVIIFVYIEILTVCVHIVMANQICVLVSDDEQLDTITRCHSSATVTLVGGLGKKILEKPN